MSWLQPAFVALVVAPWQQFSLFCFCYHVVLWKYVVFLMLSRCLSHCCRGQQTAEESRPHLKAPNVGRRKVDTLRCFLVWFCPRHIRLSISPQWW